MKPNRMQRDKMRQKMRTVRKGPGGPRGMKTGIGPLEVLLFVVIVLVVLIALNSPSFEPGEVKPSDLEQVYEREALLADLEYLVGTLEQVHPDLYGQVARAQIEAERQRIQGAIGETMTRLEFYRLAAPLLARFQDPHTRSIAPEVEYRDYLSQGALLLPMDLEFSPDGSVTVLANYSTDTLVAEGTQVLAINGVPVERMRARLLRYVSGAQQELRHAILSRNFHELQWLVFGLESPFEVTVTRAGRTGDVTRTLLGVTSEELERGRAAAAPRFGRPVASYTSLPGERIGILTVNGFDNPEGFDAVVDSLFGRVQSERIENLIVDVRHGAGGDLEVGDRLISYITGRPFAQSSRVEVRVSRDVRLFFAQDLPWYQRWYPPLFSEFHKVLWQAEPGEVVAYPTEAEDPVPNPRRYEGDVQVLIDENTYPAATLFAATVKDYGIGTLVGSETGGGASLEAREYVFSLPETKLRFAVPAMRYVRPNGEAGLLGVRPEVESEPVRRGAIRPNDPALNTAILRIRAERAVTGG